MYTARRSPARAPASPVLCVLLLPALLSGCEAEAVELAREIGAARGECTAELLRESDEECVRMMERYAGMGTELVHTYIGGLRALDRALDRMPPPEFDTEGLGYAISPEFRAGDEAGSGASPRLIPSGARYGYSPSPADGPVDASVAGRAPRQAIAVTRRGPGEDDRLARGMVRSGPQYSWGAVARGPRRSAVIPRLDGNARQRSRARERYEDRVHRAPFGYGMSWGWGHGFADPYGYGAFGGGAYAHPYGPFRPGYGFHDSYGVYPDAYPGIPEYGYPGGYPSGYGGYPGGYGAMPGYGYPGGYGAMPGYDYPDGGYGYGDRFGERGGYGGYYGGYGRFGDDPYAYRYGDDPRGYGASGGYAPRGSGRVDPRDFYELDPRDPYGQARRLPPETAMEPGAGERYGREERSAQEDWGYAPVEEGMEGSAASAASDPRAQSRGAPAPARPAPHRPGILLPPEERLWRPWLDD